MQVPAHRFANDQMVDETRLNELSDLLNYPPYVQVQRTTTFSIPNGAGYTNIPWETQTIDNEELHSGGNGMWVASNPTALTLIRSFVGRVFAKVEWPTMTALDVYLRIVKTPGTIVIGKNSTYASTATPTSLQVFSKPYAFSIGDIVIIQARHADTVSRSLQITDDGSWCSLEFINSGGLGVP